MSNVTNASPEHIIRGRSRGSDLPCRPSSSRCPLRSDTRRRVQVGLLGSLISGRCQIRADVRSFEGGSVFSRNLINFLGR